MFVPWRFIADWKCDACGLCCRAYSVVINFQEWLKISKNYGFDKTVSGLNRIFIKRNNNGSCTFLHNVSNIHFCGLQNAKPRACKLWPFKILGRPEYGYASEAAYDYGKNRLFVYADFACTGLSYGAPSWDFTSRTVMEFVEIALGQRNSQFKSTGDLNLFQSRVRLHRFGGYHEI